MPHSLVIAIAIALAPAPARGQGGPYLAPSLSVAQVYHDNVDAETGDGRAALFTRVHPQLEAGLRYPRGQARARYGLDAELDSDPGGELTAPLARHGLELDLSATLARGLAATAGGSFLATTTARDLAAATGLDPGPRDARAAIVQAGLTWRPGRRGAASAGYRYAHERQDGLVTRTHTGEGGASWRWTRRTTPGARLIARHVGFATAGAKDALTLLAGLTHALSRSTELSASAGPRVTPSGFDGVEAALAARWHAGRTRAEVAYTRGLTTVPGIPELFTTGSLSARASTSLPRRLVGALDASLFDSHAASQDARAAHAGGELAFLVRDWCRLSAGYRFAWQHVRPTAGGDTRQHVVTIALTLAGAS